MVRVILIGVGVVTTAIAGYIAQRKLFRRRGEQLPPDLATYRPSLRTRKRKTRSAPLDHALDNGEHEFGPML